jgi:hypothetical protein
MKLYDDARDAPYYERRGLQTLYWLDDLGDRPLDEASPDVVGFLFAGGGPLDDYRRLID